MAKAAKVTIVEAEEIVEVGAIGSEEVDLPGIFVDRIVPATAKKHVEILKLRSEGEVEGLKSPKTADLERRNRIAKRAAQELKQGFYVNLGVGMLSSLRKKLVYSKGCIELISILAQEFQLLHLRFCHQTERSGSSQKTVSSEW